MNKMDEYYKKQLSDYRPADDQWNVPSDELWNKALPHLPKPKKKRKFVFLLLPLGVLFLAAAIYFNQQGLESTSKPVSDYSIHTKDSTSDLTRTTIKKESQIQVSNDQEIDNTDLNYKSTSAVTPREQNKTKKPIANNDTRDTKLQANKNIVENKKTTDLNNNINTSIKTKQAGTSTSTNIETAALSSSDNYLAPSANANEKQTELEKFTKLALIESLAIQELLTNEIVPNQVFLKTPSVWTTDQKAAFSKHEIGIGSTLHLLSLLGEVENDANDEWPDEEIFFNTYQNKNLNLHYNHILNKNWFLSSGLSYHNINFDLTGCTFDVLSESSIDGFIESNLDNRLIDGPTNSRQSNNFLIELINGETVNAGDTLKVGIDLSLSLNMIQVPLAINKVWRIKRTEIFTGLGGTIDFQSWKQRSADIELYRDNKLITRPYTEGAEDPEYMIAYNIIFQTGINYAITEKLRFGLAARLFLPELIPTGFEARFLYRL